jgi:apolipoprotein N-acyltransferase
MAYAPAFLTLPADRPVLSRLVMFVLGSLTTLGFAPFGFSLLIPVLLLPLLFVCMTASPRDAGGHAFWYGFGLFLTGTYWIYISVVVFGQAPTWIAVLLMLGLALIMSAWLFVAGWLASRFAQGEPLQMLAVAPAAWVLVEWLRGWVATGFPWLAFGYANVDSAIGGFAPVGGVYGSSFAVVLSAAALLVAIFERGRLRQIAVVFVVLPFLVGGLLRIVDWTEAAGNTVRTTILQAGIPQDQKWLPEARQPTLDFYRDETRIATDSDLVVWPEVAVPSLVSREEAFISQIASDARESGKLILFGILEDVAFRDEWLIYNSVLGVDGFRRQVYRKRHLVPFGEYFPVPDKVREWLRMMSLPHSDLTPGEEFPPLIALPDGTQIAVAICYEDAYPAEQRYALPAAGILVDVSNDAWFGDSIAADQHLQIARMRSLEFGRPTVRSTNTGISAFIDHRGKLTHAGPQHEAAIITADVEPRTGKTPYAAAGDLPMIGLCVLILGFFWARTRS